MPTQIIQNDDTFHMNSFNHFGFIRRRTTLAYFNSLSAWNKTKMIERIQFEF